MERTATASETIFHRLLQLVRSALGSFTSHAATELFVVYVPGHGTTGNYSTIEKAEEARQCLPYTQRQKAIICDEAGNALCR